MEREQALKLQVGDMIKIRERYGSHLGIITKVKDGNGGVFA